MIPRGWVAAGRTIVDPPTFRDGRPRDWRFFVITLPLLHYAAYYSMEWDGVRVGWWLPKIMFRWRTGLFKMACTYEWIGKGLDREFYPHTYFEDKNIPMGAEWIPFWESKW